MVAVRLWRAAYPLGHARLSPATHALNTAHQPVAQAAPARRRPGGRRRSRTAAGQPTTASNSSGWPTRWSRPAAMPPSGCHETAPPRPRSARSPPRWQSVSPRSTEPSPPRRRVRSGGGDVQRRRTLARLRRELRRVGSRRPLPTARARRGAGSRGATRHSERGGGAMRWATRRHCHVDRTACAWLVRAICRSGRRVRVRRRPRRGAGRRDAVRHARRRSSATTTAAAASRASSSATTSTTPRSETSAGSSTRPTSAMTSTTRQRRLGSTRLLRGALADRTRRPPAAGHHRSRSTTASTSCSGDLTSTSVHGMSSDAQAVGPRGERERSQPETARPTEA